MVDDVEDRRGLSILPHYWLMSLSSSVSLRGAFLMQAGLLMLSNGIFFSFWWIYFSNFGTIRGWQLDEMALLYSIVSGGYGVASVFLGGGRFLARMIFEGDLDALIVKPKPLLIQLLGIKSVPSGWGDICCALIMFSFSSYLSLINIGLVLLLIVCSALIITAFAIVLGSLAFWLGDTHQLSKQLFEFVLTFSNYPKPIYTGMIRVFLFTVIPSGFIGFLPAETVRNHSMMGLAAILVFTTGYLAIAIAIFHRGLRKYSSGNKMGFRI